MSLPKQGFNKTYATFTTKYGSVDNEFVPLGKEDMIRVPDGIAHFLEHKLFEKEDGDVFHTFSKQGGDRKRIYDVYENGILIFKHGQCRTES